MDDHKSQSEEEKTVSFSNDDFLASGESYADVLKNVKKKKKFRPAKLMSKLKIKRVDKSYSEETPHSNSATSASSSSKIGSPKLSNLVKRLSGKKSYKVSPIQELETAKDEVVQDYQKLSHSTPNVSGDYNDLNAVVMPESFKSQPLLLDTDKPSDNIDLNKALTAENKKVQLKITISGKVNSNSDSAANNNKTEITESTIDKASQLLQQQDRADIILPSNTTQVRVSTARDKYFNVLVPSSISSQNNANTVQSISNVVTSTTQSTTSVVKEGYPEVVKESEIEKYLVVTSSLNSIISAANHLDELSKTNFPELKILKSSEEINSNGMNNKSPQSKIPISKRRSSEEHPTVHTQEARRPSQLNLSSSTEAIVVASELKPSEIKFEVGTPVRPLRVIQAANNFSPLIITETEPPLSNLPPQYDSSNDIFHSPKSEVSQSMGDKLSSSTRRKIAYIPQLTIYTPEEQELLKSNIIANSDSFDIPSIPSMTDSSIFPHFDETVSSMSLPEKREHLYKILVIGELGTGKTSFIKRYVHQFFSQNYRATIGVDFALKVLNWDQSTIIRLQLWDIAGQERFGNMTRVYFKEAVGAFIVFDVSRTATFDAVSKWKQDLDSKVQLPDGNPIPCILLANKCDLPKQGLVTMPAKMDEYCKQNNFAGWFETSAKENTNIDEAAKALVSKILLNDKLIHNDMVDGERLQLDAEDVNKNKKFCSC